MALKCSGNGIVSGFKSTIEDEKGSGMIKQSEEESASLWRKCACHGICLFVCDLLVCLFVEIKPEKLYPTSCWEGSKPPGSDHTRAEAQTTCIPKTAAQATYLSIYG